MVAIWVIIDEKNKVLEVEYVETHENINYNVKK